MKRTGAQILWECLVREGVSTVFGYPGGSILAADDAVLDYPIRHVRVRREQIATLGRPGPVLSDITKDAQQASCEFDWDAAAPKPHARPERIMDQAALASALSMINNAKRPMILAGHGIMQSEASGIVQHFAER